MIERVTHVSLLVDDQEQALAWYQKKLGFEVVADSEFPDDQDQRWLTIAPPGQTDLQIVLEPMEWGLADPDAKRRLLGRAPGFVMSTDDCRRDYKELSRKGVEFHGEPEELEWGISATFEDLYGTVHNLLEVREA